MLDRCTRDRAAVKVQLSDVERNYKYYYNTVKKKVTAKKLVLLKKQWHELSTRFQKIVAIILTINSYIVAIYRTSILYPRQKKKCQSSTNLDQYFEVHWLRECQQYWLNTCQSLRLRPAFPVCRPSAPAQALSCRPGRFRWSWNCFCFSSKNIHTV